MQTETELAVERRTRGRGSSGDSGLPELLEALRWRWRTTLVITLAFTLGATLLIESLQAQYDGRAMLSIGPRQPAVGSDIVRVLGPTYPDYITAPSTVRTVARRIDEDTGVLQKAVDANIPTDTGTVRITVRLPDPVRAAVAANAFADEALAFSQTDRQLVAQRIVTALPPTEPAAPPRRLLELASLLIGGLLGVVVSLLIERGRPRLRTWRDLARSTGYAVIGRIPPSRTLHNRPTHAFADPATASAFRIIRANLEPQLRDGGIDFIVVTSPQPGDGKTTVSTLLSESLARLGMKVLLVDADLRRPGLSRLTRLTPEPGLSQVLRGEMPIVDAIQEGWIENVWVLPTAPDPEAGDLLARRFAEVVEDARDRFDVIVVDTPPLLGTDDPRTLATMAKGILLVVSAGASASAVNEAVIAVEALNAPLMGIIGNRFKETRQPYYY